MTMSHSLLTPIASPPGGDELSAVSAIIKDSIQNHCVSPSEIFLTTELGKLEVMKKIYASE